MSQLGPLGAPASATVRPGAPGLLRLLADNLVPALLFGGAAVLRCLVLLKGLREAPADPASQVWLAYLLNLAHQLLACLFAALIATLFLIRRAPRSQRAGPLPLLIALGGTLIMNLTVFQDVTTQDWRVLAAADLLLSAGLAFSLYAAASLRECFGMAPEARGLVTSGAYRLVRHPLYLGEFVAFSGLLLPVLGPVTVLIFLVFCALQATRAVMEERVLSATFPEYADYRRRTPALLPWARPK